jgi:hypothetical protein
MYVEAQKSKMNKQAGILTNSALGALAGAGVGGLGTLGYDYLKGKKLNLRNALYGGLIGALPGAAVGGLMTEMDSKKDDKNKNTEKSWTDTVRSLSESKPNGPLDTLANEAALAGAGIMAAPGNAALAGTGGYVVGKRLAGGLFNFQNPEATGLKSQIQDILNTPRPVGPGLEPARMRAVANPGAEPIYPLKATGMPYSPSSAIYKNYLRDAAAYPGKLDAFKAFEANQAAHQAFKQKGYDYGEALKVLKHNQNKLPGLRDDLNRILATKGTAGQTLNGKPGGWTRSGVGGIPGALLAILASGPVSNYMGNYYKKED